MNLGRPLNRVLTADSMTVASQGDVAPVSLNARDLALISGLLPTGSLGQHETASAGDHSCVDATEERPAPAVYIDDVPVTVSVQNVDGQQRIVCVATDASGGTVSYVGQLTSDESLEFQSEAPPQPLFSEEDVPPLLTTAELLPVHSLPTALQALDHLEPLDSCLLLEGSQVPQDSSAEEPKKRKGGWPKGKKRKPQREFSAPRAPTTGYVIFVKEQKVHLKAENPDLPFTEITKMLGVQWSQLSVEAKQKYNTAAERDKQRYIRELISFQSSEAYKAFLRRKALIQVKGCGIACDNAELENEAFALSQIDGDTESSGLYCRTCNQYFSSLHNKKEHLLGKQHLQTLTEEFEKETGIQKKSPEPEKEEGNDEEEDEEEEETELARLDVSVLQELLLRRMNLREFELHELKASLDLAQKKQERLNKVLEEFQMQKACLERELQGLRDRGGALEAQLHGLNAVPLLIHLQLQIVETGKAAMPEQSLAMDSLMK